MFTLNMTKQIANN